MGKYDDIVSARDAGWLALNSENARLEGGKQYLLDEKGSVIKEFSGTYEMCFGNKYLFRSKNVRLEGDDSYRTMSGSEGEKLVN